MRGRPYLQIGSKCMGMLMMRLLTHRSQIVADVGAILVRETVLVRLTVHFIRNINIV